MWQKIKKAWPLILLCLGVVALSYGLLFQHYRKFNFSRNDFIYKIESKLLDLRILMRGKQKPTGKVGILAIDEKSIEAFGRWPFSRKYYAKAFENLKNRGVHWLGFDSIYSEAERTYLDEIAPDFDKLGKLDKALAPQSLKPKIAEWQSMLKSSPSDQSFAAAIQAFENIVLGYFYFGSEREAKKSITSEEKFRGFDTMAPSALQNLILPDGKSLSDYKQISKAHGLVANIPAIAKSTPHFAFFSNDADDDAINRWVNLIAETKGQLMPSLSLKTVAEALNREIVVFFDSVGVENIGLVNRDDDSDIIEVPVDPLGTGRVLVNHRGPGQSFHHYSLADAYNDSFTKAELESLKGSILLLGATATGTNDMRPNPFDPTIDGVENHAAVIDNILQKDYLKRPVDIYSTELLIVLSIGFLFAPLMIWGRALFSALAIVAFLVGYYFFDKYFWFGRGIWAFIAIPSFEILTMFIVCTLYKYMTEEREKKKVKGAFSMYLSPDVISQVLEDPEKLSLGGVRKELTVFFSDVRGFTTISESLSPEKLCELMNDYFTPMTGIILRSKGVLDKYIGDAIMAFWGAPLDLPNHADSAAQACIDMLFAMDRIKSDFAQKNFPPIDIGIGLNTGNMSVGNMGSGERFCYTVMGDSVNLGARLEGLTKEYGIKIMISEFTKAKLSPGKFFLRDLDDIRVKGKNLPVNVFDLMRPDYLPEQRLIQEFIELFNAARLSYKGRDFEKSHRLFSDCLKMKAEDKATKLYLERLEVFKAKPPDETWDGVYTFTHK